MGKGEYKIAFGALKAGEYRFQFEVGDDFWAEFPTSGVLGGELAVDVEMERLANGLTLDFEIDGAVKVECDRCLDELELPIEYDGVLTVRFSDEVADDYDGETMWLSRSETEVDLKQYIYESVLLALPYQRMHGEGGCNPEMLSKMVNG